MGLSQAEVLKRFKCGKDRGTASNFFIGSDGKRLYSYGHHFTLALHRDGDSNRHPARRGEPWVLLNGDKYSSTTSAHQSSTFSAFPEQPRVAFSALRAAFVDEQRCVLLDCEPDYYENYTRNAAEQSEREFLDSIPEQPMGASRYVSRYDQTHRVSVGYKTVKKTGYVRIDGEWKWSTEPVDQEEPVYETRPHPYAGQIHSLRFHRVGTVLLREDRPLPDYATLPNRLSEAEERRARAMKRRYYLCGMDEGSYFCDLLPRSCKTVREAFEILIPPEVHAATAEKKTVERQGEWFFVPLDIPEHQRSFFAKLAKMDFHREHELPTKDSQSNRHVAAWGMEYKGRHLVRGAVRHRDMWGNLTREHTSVRLGNQIHVAVCNTSVAAWSASGTVD